MSYADGGTPLPGARGDLYPLPGDTTRFWDASSVNALRAAIADIIANPGLLGVLATGSTTARSLKDRFADVVNVKDYGAKGDGTTDDTAALNAAAAAAKAAGVRLILGKGTFKTTTILAFDGVDVFGEGPNNTAIQYYGSGTAVSFRAWKGNRLENLRITSRAAGQSGLLVYGEHARVETIYLDEFDTNGLQIGTANVVGCYYAKISNVYVNNPTVQGAVGVLIGGGVPSSNENTLEQILVSGRWTKLSQNDGTTNVFIGGDFDPDTTGTGVSVIWEINGSHNIVMGTYSELIGASTVPAKLVIMGASSDGNRILGLNIRYGGWGPSTHVQNLGWHNQIDVSPIGVNFPTLPQSVTSDNLVPNSAFTAWDATLVRPYGWVDQGYGGANAATLAQEATIVHGATRSLKVSGTGIAFNIASFIFSGTAGDKSEKQLPIGYFLGQMVTCSVWCNSAYANIGNVRVATNGTGGASWGKVHHSGSGTWEILTASGLIPADASKVWMELRASNGGGTLTGDVYFSDPMCVVGTRLPYYSPRPLNDMVAQMHGAFSKAPPVTLAYSGSIATDASLGNIFEVTPSNGSGYTLSNPTNLRTGQTLTYVTVNTFGVLGTQSFGSAFRVSAWTQPANGYSRSVTFYYNGTVLRQIDPAGVDIPN